MKRGAPNGRLISLPVRDLSPAVMCTTRCGSAKGSPRRKRSFIKLKIAVFSPIPNASVMTASTVKPGDLRSWRRANFRSFMSFSAQGFDWIDVRRAARRNQTSEQRRECQHDRGRSEQQWIVWRNLIKLRRQQTADGKCSGQTNNQTKDYRIHSLPHDQTQHIRCLRAQRHAHTDLAGALFDCVSDGTVNSNDGEQ